MKQLVNIERFFLIGHILAMAFGLAGLLIVLPHPELIASLSPLGQTLFQWSMSGGGVVYIILGAVAVAIYAYRTLGLWQWLTFMVPAVLLSLGSELLGTSTGFPFGHYGYLSGLGYKVADLVPFTIPLSWFYLGLVSYLIARVGLEARVKPAKPISWLRHLGAIAIGAILLTSWDFVLDPAMSQANVPFWLWYQPGAFFGMPYQNFAGWLGTGALFMTVAALFWKKTPVSLSRKELGLPLAIYLSNFVFATVMSIGAGIWTPVGLGILLGVAPAVGLWWMAASASTPTAPDQLENSATTRSSTTTVPAAPVGVLPK
ncbi:MULTISPECIES: gamma-carotene 1'-hydroxylase CruF [unclassified Coleofasciculus]|uniref:gamma-carotene 1'-hydroxylase CruF n=1 Tax=unclassified Coleofasciculus TaxID=2692782 RepID=UPI00187F7D3B|nr:MULTISPECIES: carotenoid biosynthesis protein [unclassified Coleofasciculus]MBE9130156.1 carotenoid biosynthesis protein [Coleofasciculus sp. LEGE 07081]MBE9152493.1 carotenoid biosynthesis protein [Coleofasciculus sp. LEGE 07092]